jgi:probable rRNA maturation factor
MKLKIYYENSQEEIPVTYKLKMLLRRAILAALEYEKKYGEFEVSITFTNNSGIRELNRTYRERDSVTDVLSFPIIDFLKDKVDYNDYLMLGDIVISLERAEEQAKEYGHGFDREVAFLSVHSTLHLLGYDHELSEEDDTDMRERQRDIMKKIGLQIN